MRNLRGSVRSFIIRRHRLRIASLLLQRLLPVAAIAAGTILLQCLLFACFPFTAFPILLDATLLAAAVCAVTAILYTVAFRRPSLFSTAATLDTELKAVTRHPVLHIALEFTFGKHTPSDSSLQDEVLHTARRQIASYASLSRKPLPSPPAVIQTAIILTCLVFAVFFHPALLRYWQLPVQLMSTPAAGIRPGTIRVPKGASVTLSMHCGTSRIPSARLLLYHPDNRTGLTRHLRPDTSGSFCFTIDSMVNSTVYRFSYGTYTSAAETISVVPPPYLTSLQAKITPPAYTGIDTVQTVQGQSDLTLYEGSDVHFTLGSPGLSSAALIFNSDTILCSCSGATAACTLSARTAGRCRFMLIDTFEQRTDSAGSFSLRIIPDELPRIRFVRPGHNKNLEPALIETLFVEASDDLGIRRATLSWYRGGGQDSTCTDVSISPPLPRRQWQTSFAWNINRLSLYPGDTVYYWASAWDTYPYDRRRKAVTDTFWFRVPTFAEMHRAMADRESHAQELLSGASQRQSRIEQQVEQLDKATSGGMRKENREPSWEEKQLADRINEGLREQTDSLGEALTELQKNAEKLRDEGVLNEDLAKKMDEIRKAVEELVKQYGDSLLFPKNNRGDLSLSEMKEAVQKLQQMLPELGERLDNTLKYLEALKKDRELAMLAAQAEKLADEQAMLAQQSNSPETSDREKDLLDRIQKLRNEASEKLPAENTREQQQTLADIDSAAAQLQKELSESSRPSSSGMRQMSGSLASLAQQMREQTSDYRRQQLEKLRADLLDMADNGIRLSEWQEQISDQHPADETSRRSQALSQQALSQAAGQLQNRLGDLRGLPPSLAQQLSSSLRASQQAADASVQALGAGSGTFAMNLTARTLRQSANDLMRIVEAMDGQNSGSCNSGSSGMQESLRRMSGKQAAINAATASLLRRMLEGRKRSMSSSGGEAPGSEGEQREAIRQAQKRQQELADDLKKLAEKFGNADDASVKKRIDDLEQEARALAAMIQSPNEEVTERQDRFLARMLQAALSLHREEEGKEDRQSKTAQTIFTIRSAAPVDSTAKGADAFYELRRRALQSGTFPQTYRASINAYFDSLGVMYLR